MLWPLYTKPPLAEEIQEVLGDGVCLRRVPPCCRQVQFQSDVASECATLRECELLGDRRLERVAVGIRHLLRLRLDIVDGKVDAPTPSLLVASQSASVTRHEIFELAHCVPRRSRFRGDRLSGSRTLACHYHAAC
jgi:hypothetical protein